MLETPTRIVKSVSTTPEVVYTKKVARKQVLSKFVASRWSLPVVVFLQVAISLLTLQNTAFQDEALYLFAGRQILHSWLGGPPVADPYVQYFSGFPYFYPILGGALDKLGGVEAARAFSLLCMIGVTLCTYAVTKKIFGRDCAIWAAIFFAFQSPVLFMGRLATYDALCFLLLALAAVMAVKISTSRFYWLALALGPMLFLAVVAKYAGMLFVPSILALLALCTYGRLGWGSMFRRVGVAFSSFLAVAVCAFLSLNQSIIKGISSTTTNRVAVVANSPVMLLTHIVELSGVAFAIALLGLWLVGRKQLLLGLLLFGSALLAPAYHLYKGELVSLDKHLAFGMFFLAPLMGYAIASITKYQQRIFSHYNWLSGVAAFLIVFSLGIEQSQYLYGEWTASSTMTYMLETQVRSGSGRYLVEDYDVSRYYLQNVSKPWQWNSLDFFAYTTKTHQQLVGKPAYDAAIKDGYFDLVELSFGYNASLAQYITSTLKTDHDYELIAKIPYRNAYGTGYTWLWRKHVPTNATSS